MEKTFYDPRLEAVEDEKEAALKQTDAQYTQLLDQTRSNYDQLIAAEDDYAAEKSAAQQKETDLKVEQLLQEQADAKADNEKEKAAAYTDYQTQVNPYSPETEKMAAAGLSHSGYSESAKAGMFNAYQNRVAVAQQGFDQAVRDYDIAIREARQQNDAALAKIAYDALKRRTNLVMKAANQYTQLQQKWEKQRQDQEKYFEDLEEQVYEEVLENPGDRAAEPSRLPDSPDADKKWWAI